MYIVAFGDKTILETFFPPQQFPRFPTLPGTSNHTRKGRSQSVKPFSIHHFRYIKIELSSEVYRTQTKELVWMTVFIHFFGLCTPGFILKLHFSISKVHIGCRKTKTKRLLVNYTTRPFSKLITIKVTAWLLSTRIWRVLYTLWLLVKQLSAVNVKNMKCFLSLAGLFA